jgi:hypothetical protein
MVYGMGHGSQEAVASPMSKSKDNLCMNFCMTQGHQATHSECQTYCKLNEGGRMLKSMMDMIDITEDLVMIETMGEMLATDHKTKVPSTMVPSSTPRMPASKVPSSKVPSSKPSKPSTPSPTAMPRTAMPRYPIGV